MAWKEVLPMDERLRFVMFSMESKCSFAELCEEFGISRKTGYKWRNRFHAEGLLGLIEKSRCPRRSPQRTSQWVVDLALEEKRRHLSWGPKKIAWLLEEHHGLSKAPSASTLGELFKRHGLSKKRRRKRCVPRRWPGNLTTAQEPNDVWAIDFKGWFRTRDGRRCDSLTVSDLFSRYVLCSVALPDQKLWRVRPILEQIFKERGLPQVIRSDNGAPFASTGAGGVSQLSVWWMRLGITPEFIEPGHPEQNGSHERMHRTLKDETTRPPGYDLESQQERFDEWRSEFNENRPHEGIGMQCPGTAYTQSLSLYPGKLADFHYPRYYEIRRVMRRGQIKWRNKFTFIGEAFARNLIGLEEVDEGVHRVYAGDMVLGYLDNSTRPARLQPAVSPSQALNQKITKKLLPMSPD